MRGSLCATHLFFTRTTPGLEEKELKEIKSRLDIAR